MKCRIGYKNVGRICARVISQQEWDAKPKSAKSTNAESNKIRKWRGDAELLPKGVNMMLNYDDKVGTYSEPVIIDPKIDVERKKILKGIDVDMTKWFKKMDKEVYGK